MTLTAASTEEFAYHLNALDGVDIVDMTHLSGNYDFIWTIARDEMCELCPDTPRLPVSASTPTEKESLLKLGFKLQKQRVPVDVFLIDHLEKTPTEN
jgi:uncharacterized protein (TIGR03435 family)